MINQTQERTKLLLRNEQNNLLIEKLQNQLEQKEEQLRENATKLKQISQVMKLYTTPKDSSHLFPVPCPRVTRSPPNNPISILLFWFSLVTVDSAIVNHKIQNHKSTKSVPAAIR